MSCEFKNQTNLVETHKPSLGRQCLISQFHEHSPLQEYGPDKSTPWWQVSQEGALCPPQFTPIQKEICSSRQNIP